MIKSASLKSADLDHFEWRRSVSATTYKWLNWALNFVLVAHWMYPVWLFSQSSNPSYSLYSHKLQDGWLFGRKIDNSDSQYSSFRRNIPILVAVMIGHQTVSMLLDAARLKKSSDPSLKMKWTLIFSTVFIFALFGSSAIKIISIISLHYVLVKWDPKMAPYTTWIFGIAILFINDQYNGYNFSDITSQLSFLDEWKGAGLRWNITFNFTILRMISFSMDYSWALYKPQSPKDKVAHISTCAECSESPNMCKRQRLETSHPIEDYDFFNYLTYCLYAPLYMAGPILAFNDFKHQLLVTPKSIQRKSTNLYAYRWIGAVILMEVLMHCCYVVAIKDTKAWKGYTSLEIYLVGFFNLKVIWLKLLIIWRFFRLWAMNDGIETTENMGRCMSNHYSGIDFWREWHASFNRWLIRYLYIPLGGAKYKALNSFPIFSFVAIWHDIEGRLLAWGWLIALFILPELIANRIFVNVAVVKLTYIDAESVRELAPSSLRFGGHFKHSHDDGCQFGWICSRSRGSIRDDLSNGSALW